MEAMKVATVARLLGVSNQAVYQRLSRKDNGLTANFFKENGITYITPEGIEILQKVFAARRPEKESTVDKQSDDTRFLKDELMRKQETIMAQQATLDSMLSKHSEERARTDTIIMKLTNDVGKLQQLLENKTVVEREILTTPPVSIVPWQPSQKADPMKNVSWLQRFFASLFYPETLRSGAD